MQNRNAIAAVARYAWFALGLLLACAVVAAPQQAVNLKTQMRLPWPIAAAGKPHPWLLCGAFPLSPDEGEEANAPRLAFHYDYLQGHGGERDIRPTVGMTHTGAKGEKVAWTRVNLTGDLLTFNDPFAAQPPDVAVWYACTTLRRTRAGAAALAISSSSAVRVWLNGKLVDEQYLDQDAWHDDLRKVALQAGENTLLVKVLQREDTATAAVRVLELPEAGVLGTTDDGLLPVLAPGKGRLIVATDVRHYDFHPDGAQPPVQVDVLAPGGTVVDSLTVARGEQATFTTDRWPTGPYEVRCTMTNLRGEPVHVYRLGYHGDAAAAARALVTTAPKHPETSTDLLRGMLAEMVKDRVHHDLVKMAPAVLPALYPILMEDAELTQNTAVHANGLVRLAWRDPLDDSPQFCRVYLPYHFDARKRYPLVVALHGRAGDFPPYVQWGGSDQRHDGMADRDEVIVAYPHGRGNAWFRGMGEQDVLRCVAEIKARFPVDDDRVYLKGYSMGGAGVWYVGTRHPDLFAALAPFYGGYDFRFQLNGATLAKLTPHERYRRERLSYIAQLEALLTTPVFASHGDADSVVPIDYSRYTVRLLERWGYPVRYWERPGAGHGGMDETAVNSWLLAQRRVNNPPHVRVRAADLRTAHAHWVAITQRKDPYAFVLADAEVVAPNYIRVTTSNVLEMILTPAAPLVDAGQPVTIVWNGTQVRTLRVDDAGRLLLRARGYAPAKLVKRPGMEGPVTDLFNTPLALVVGTSATDPLMRAMVARAARRFQTWWNERQHCPLRCYTDLEAQQIDLSTYSLLLFGGPSENRLAKILAGRIPLTITPTAITVDGKVFPAHDAAVQMLYPSPLAPDRYVVIRAATSPAGMFLSDYVLNDVDLSIVDARNADPARLGQFFDVVTGRNSGPILAAGYFDNAWRLKDSNLERSGNTAVKPWCVPYFPTAAFATGRQLALAEVLESRAEGAFGDMMRNTTTRGSALRPGGKHVAGGISLPSSYWLPEWPCWAEFDLGHKWSHLRGLVGLEVAGYTLTQRAHTSVVFVVKGDGKQLYRSRPFSLDTPPARLNLNVAGVRTLRLEVLNTTTGESAITAVDWADMRLER